MTSESDAEKKKKLKNLIGLIVGLIVSVTVIIALPNIAWVFCLKTGSDNLNSLKFDDAKNSFNQAVLLARLFPQTDDRIIFSLNNLAAVLMAQGNYKEAGKTIDESIKISKDRYGYGEKLTKPLLIKAGFYKRQGKYSEAIKTYKEVLKILDKKRDGVYSGTLLNASSLEIFRGNYREAEKGLKQVLKVNEKIKQNTVINVTYVTLNLGKVEEAKGNYKSADKMYDKALEVLKPVLEQNKSIHALILNLKARLKLNENNANDAEPLINKAYSLTQVPSPSEYLHAANLESLLNLTRLYLLERKYKRAEKIVEQSLPIASSY